MADTLLDVQQQKGAPEALDGRLTVYARIDMDPAELAQTKHPVASMAQNGLIVAQGNFKEQNSLRDFLKSEMGLSLEEGLEQLVEKLDGFESALDPEKLKEKIESMDEMQDFIPTPAKIVPFESEEEILEQEGDVFFTGRFKNIGNAVLSVNAFPILYQARYREQMMENVRGEIDNLIAQIERNELPRERCTSSDVDVEQKIVKDFIPNMLYCRKDPNAFEAAQKQFRTFMTGYPFGEDVDAIVNLVRGDRELTSRHYKLLELYARKVAEIINENFAEVEKTKRSIAELEKEGL